MRNILCSRHFIHQQLLFFFFLFLIVVQKQAKMFPQLFSLEILLTAPSKKYVFLLIKIDFDFSHELLFFVQTQPQFLHSIKTIQKPQRSGFLITRPDLVTYGISFRFSSSVVTTAVYLSFNFSLPILPVTVAKLLNTGWKYTFLNTMRRYTFQFSINLF